MSNPLYQQMNQQTPVMNNFQQMIKSFQQFKQMFSGDPRQRVQQLLNSGKVSQSDYNRAVQMAQQLQKMMNGK